MNATVVSADLRFEWDQEKDMTNMAKHGIHFSEILAVFDDPHFLERYDRLNSSLDETRYIGLGMLDNVLPLLVCYTERAGRTRLFSVRKTSPEEKREYEQYHKQFV
jgi:uncharacterized DUF497 family protein